MTGSTRLLLLCLVASSLAAAQGPAFRRLREMLPPGQTGTLHPIDADGDGDLDLLEPASRLLVNDGRGHYEPGPVAPPLPAVTGFSFPGAVAAADFDQDGDEDALVEVINIAIDTFFSSLVLWVNDGAGTFTAAPLSIVPPPSLPLFTTYAEADVASADLDQDGDADLVVATSGAASPLRVWLNNGSATFAEQVIAAAPAGAAAVRIADLDGDGDQDLVVTGGATFFAPAAPAQVVVLLNAGGASFPGPPIVIEPAGAAPPVLGDVNGDGLVDLFLTRAVGGPVEHRLHLNGGGGTFNGVTVAATFGTLAAAAFVDLTADGQDELVRAGGGALVAQAYLGGGLFGPPLATVALVSINTGPFTGTLELMASDVDADSDRDLVIGAYAAEPQLLLNTAAGGLVAARQTVLPAGERYGLLGDLDGDGDRDLLLSGAGGVRLHANAGNGVFAPSAVVEPPLGPLFVYPFEVSLFDQDGDGDTDVLLWLGPSFSQYLARVLLNLGGGAFAPTVNVPSTLSTRTVAAGDLDLDGDDDLVLGRYTVTALPGADPVSVTPLGVDVVLSTGPGTFAAPVALPGPVDFARGLALLDADGDLDLDLFVLNEGTGPAALASQLFANNGAGGFTLAASYPGLNGFEVASGDVDGNLSMDLVVRDAAGGVQLVLNGFAGALVPAGPVWPAAPAPPRSLQLADANGDGALDLVAGLLDRAVTLLGDGLGGFAYDPRYDVTIATPPIGVPPARPLAGDLDGDRDADLVFAGESPMPVFTSADFQLWRRDVPALGKPLTLELRGQAGDAFALGAALAPAMIPAGAAGTLLLDPATLALVATGTLDPTGAASLTLPVPALPPLSGLAISWQFLDTTAFRLSNLELTLLTDA